MDNLIFPTEKSVLDYMAKNKIKKMKMYITAYVNHSNYQDYGFSIKNINSDYYFNQKVISSKTKLFNN